ncbi:MAG: hypothetical protein NUV75_12635 [Gallionella sp.]|nr:hypothetical protein [Gallionella sp.]
METALLYEKGAHSITWGAGIPHETEKAFHHEEHEAHEEIKAILWLCGFQCTPGNSS